MKIVWYRTAGRLAGLFLSVLGLFTLTAQVVETEKVKRVAVTPANAAEIREQIAKVEMLLPEVSDRAAALYYLSTAQQQLSNTVAALALLRESLALHEGFDPAGSPSLKMLKGTKEFDSLVQGVHREFPAVGHARFAFATKEKDLVPEGLAYDIRQNVFYLSSLNLRKIVKITRNGEASDFVPSGRDNLLPVLGIRVDPADGTVWAASWSEDAGKSELLHFDTGGKLLDRRTPKDSSSHGFNDLVVRNTGEIVITDSVSNQVYRFDPKAKLFSRVPVYRSLSAPNGIALADDDRKLFVGDDFGVVRVDLSKASSVELIRAPHSTLAGIDGLYWNHGSLIAVQNGIGSPRIVAFRLSRDSTRVEQTTVLENRTAFTITPTTGAICGNDFYFMANSQGDNLSGDQIVDPKKLQPVRVGVLPLP